MKPFYLELFSDQDSVIREFSYHKWVDPFTPDQKIIDDLFGAEILLAYYSYEDYSGTAFVLYRKFGELFEVNGGHCSCYGLEGQWEPEKTSIKELRHRIKEGNLGREYSWRNEGVNRFANELTYILDLLEEGH